MTMLALMLYNIYDHVIKLQNAEISFFAERLKNNSITKSMVYGLFVHR